MEKLGKTANGLLDQIQRAKEQSLKKEQTYEQTPVPFTEEHILTPTLLGRVSPFKPMKRGQKRIFHEGEILFNKNQFGYIKYTGQTLGMDDQDVFLQLLKMAREDLFAKKEVIKLEFSLRWFLKEMGRQVGGKQAKQLKNSFSRMTATEIQINNKQGRTFGGSLINSWDIDEETGKCLVWLNPHISHFYFRYGGYTQLNFEQRQHLTGDITKALHLFLSSQRNKKNGYRFEYTLQDFAEILNLGEYTEIWKMRQTLKKAFDQLYKDGFLHSFCMNGNLIEGIISAY